MGCANGSHTEHLFWIRRVIPEELHSLSKTTKLLLLDSLLQEVCIESGSDGSLALSVCLVSHNLLYSGLKKAHSKMKSMKKNKKPCMILMSTLGPLPCPSPQSESSSQMMVTRVQKVVYSNLYSQAGSVPGMVNLNFSSIKGGSGAFHTLMGSRFFALA